MTSSAKRNEVAADGQAADLALAVPVWDLPVRLFHWSLVALIAFSWWSAENDRVELHMWSGLAILSLLIFRILWGFFGSSTARFASFVRGPAAVADYLRAPRDWNALGHTPLGALSVIALLSLITAQVALGLVISDEDGLHSGPLARLVSFDTAEAARDWHETLFNFLLAVIALHVAAVIIYRLVWGKKLTSAMVTGRTQAAAGAQPMRPGKWWVALLCLLAGVGLTRWIIAGAPPFGG
jgi:cytochrome b